MIHVVVSIKDSAVDAFLRPWFVQAVGQASRTFSDEVNRVADDNSMYRHPEDYILYELGSFDDSTGQLQSLGDPRQVCRGIDVHKGVN